MDDYEESADRDRGAAALQVVADTKAQAKAKIRV